MDVANLFFRTPLGTVDVTRNSETARVVAPRAVSCHTPRPGEVNLLRTVSPGVRSKHDEGHPWYGCPRCQCLSVVDGEHPTNGVGLSEGVLVRTASVAMMVVPEKRGIANIAADP